MALTGTAGRDSKVIYAIAVDGVWEVAAVTIPRRRPVLSSLVTVILAAITMTACTDPEASESGDRNPGTTASSPVPSSSAASPADEASEAALAAYTGMWDDMVEAAKTSNWKDPNLGRHATKDALRVITGLLYADHKNGVVTKGRPTYDPEVSSVKPKTAPKTVLVSDCGDDSRWLKYWKKSGKPVDDEPGGRRQITAEVKLQTDGNWRVTRFAVQGVGTCS